MLPVLIPTYLVRILRYRDDSHELVFGTAKVIHGDEKSVRSRFSTRIMWNRVENPTSGCSFDRRAAFPDR